MSIVQVWLVVGIPALVLALSLFARRSLWRALTGYVVLVAAFALVAAVDRASGAVFGGLLALLYGSGRGGRLESGPTEVSSLEAVPEVTRRVARERAAGARGTPVEVDSV